MSPCVEAPAWSTGVPTTDLQRTALAVISPDALRRCGPDEVIFVEGYDVARVRVIVAARDVLLRGLDDTRIGPTARAALRGPRPGGTAWVVAILGLSCVVFATPVVAYQTGAPS